MNELAAMHHATDVGPLRIDELLRPEAFPHPVGHLELRETPMSWVILTGPFAYKIKKPMKEDLLDSSTLEARRRLCGTELRLNRRYAAEIYVDVVPISRKQGWAAVGAVAPAIDYAVRMKQFDATDELHELIDGNDIALPEVVALAELLADFHMRAPILRSNGAHPQTAWTRKIVLGNLAQLIAHLPPTERPETLGQLTDWIHDNAHSLESSFQRREDSGCIRECHGDLQVGSIVRWQGRLVPFDGIDFAPQQRWIDVMDDLASLVMDLVSRERTDLAFALLSRYLEITGDYAGLPLLRFYAVHRALVRAKNDALAAEQLPHQATELCTRLRQRVCAATAWMAPRRPALILMHGSSDSGKSWLSERLIAPLAAVRVCSELERKRLAGIKPQLCATTGMWQGVEAKELAHKTYERLADCAQYCLQAGFNTIVDATFLGPADRERFRELAVRLGAAWVLVSCRNDLGITSDRTRPCSRARGGAAYDGAIALEALRCTISPLSADEQRHVIPIDTNDASAVHRVTAAVGELTEMRLDLVSATCSS